LNTDARGVDNLRDLVPFRMREFRIVSAAFARWCDAHPSRRALAGLYNSQQEAGENHNLIGDPAAMGMRRELSEQMERLQAEVR
jgi:hypothetical protein